MARGLVIKSTGSWFTVKSNDGKIINCKIKGNFRIKDLKATNPVTVGDKVDYSLNIDYTGLIESIEDRKNYIIRRSSNLSKQYQIIAANIDQAWIIATLTKPKTFLEFIDRYLVSAEAYRIPVSIIFNKIDLYDKALLSDLQEIMDMYCAIGYKCYKISALEKINIAGLINSMKGKINLLSGNSGVGKSTLINTINPTIDARTGDISEYHKKGKHTTTFAQMFNIFNDSYIIDTPGIKGFGMVDLNKNEIFHFFPEIFRKSSECQFYNCLHVNEPGCAVKVSVERKQISLSRYQSYLSILNENNGKYR